MIAKFAAAVAIAAAALTAAGAAKAQDLNAMNNAFNAQLNAAMGRVQGNIVNQNMNDPRVVAAWRQNPRGMSLQQYAYAYAATGGFTPQGMANYNNTSQNIARQQQQAWAGYQGAVQNYRNAYNGWTAGQSANMQEAGRGLMGQQSYYNPYNGQNVALRYIQPGQTWSQGGYTYSMAPDGNYYASTGNGYWTRINPAAMSPR